MLVAGFQGSSVLRVHLFRCIHQKLGAELLKYLSIQPPVEVYYVIYPHYFPSSSASPAFTQRHLLIMDATNLWRLLPTIE